MAHLVSQALRDGRSPVDAVAVTLPRLRGAFALVFLFAGEEDLLIGARHGAPLAIGYGDGEMYLGSDALALAPFTDNVTYLEDGDWVVLSRTRADIRDATASRSSGPGRRSRPGPSWPRRATTAISWPRRFTSSPRSSAARSPTTSDFADGQVCLPFTPPFDFDELRRVSISACGTAYYAGLIGKYWFERLARLPVEIDVASEFRYREAPLEPGGLALFVSQSGETADTLASLRYAKQEGQHVLSVVNVPTSTMARESAAVAPTLAGPEIGVASTKAFTCQLTVLLCLAIAAGRARGTLSESDEKAARRGAGRDVPSLMAEALKREAQIEVLARDLAKARDVLYLGRGTSYPLALEGALKLKEISYIHAEGYAAGELKHGPIALIDESMPVIVIAPHDAIFEKTVSNMQEVAARGGKIILITDERGAAEAGLDTIATILMPPVHPAIAPLVYAVPVAASGLSHGRFHGQRRRPAAQPRQVGHGGVRRPQRDAAFAELACALGRAHVGREAGQIKARTVHERNPTLHRRFCRAPSARALARGRACATTF